MFQSREEENILPSRLKHSSRRSHPIQSATLNSHGGTEMSEQPNSKTSPYGIVTGLLAGGLTAYFIYDYSGPYRWVAEAQMSIMGSFSQKLSFLLTFLVVWGVVALIALPLRKAFSGGAATTPPWATPGAV